MKPRRVRNLDASHIIRAGKIGGRKVFTFETKSDGKTFKGRERRNFSTPRNITKYSKGDLIAFAPSRLLHENRGVEFRKSKKKKITEI